MKLSDFKNKKRVGILGFGMEGQATLNFLKYFFPDKEYLIADQKDGENYLEKIEDCDVIVKTPGIKKEILKGKNYTTATNIFFANAGGMKIGVTGTKGKSTISNLIYSILKKADKQVFLVGNIGNSMLDELLQYCKTKKITTAEELAENIDKKIIYICELSSYQLSDIKYSPDISVINNLYFDHMDYHEGVENYWQAKKNIVKYAKGDDIFVYNQGFEELKKLAGSLEIKTVPLVEESFLENIKQKTLLLGAHNFLNMRVAATVAKVLGIDKKNIFEAIQEIKPLKHRLEFIGEHQGIFFYDDAISTTPESTMAAIEALKKVNTIFLGGLDRGYDFEKLGEVINSSQIKNIVLFPDSGKKILSFLEAEKFNILKTKSMKEAVEFAYQKTKKNQICLLSTASPSYGVWKNFEEKGEEFVRWVEKFLS